MASLLDRMHKISKEIVHNRKERNTSTIISDNSSITIDDRNLQYIKHGKTSIKKCLGKIGAGQYG